VFFYKNDISWSFFTALQLCNQTRYSSIKIEYKLHFILQTENNQKEKTKSVKNLEKYE
jgi:hypothetical protein